MAEPQQRIHPARQVVMVLPETDLNKDPWTGAAIETGRNLPDDAPIDENVQLLPPLGKTSAEVGAELADPVESFHPAREATDDNSLAWAQFSLGDVMFMTAVVCVALAIVRLLPPGPLAACAGLLTLSFFWAVQEFSLKNRWIRNCGIALVTVYLICTGAALVQVWLG